MKYVALLLISLLLAPLALSSSSGTQYVIYSINFTSGDVNGTALLTIQTSPGHPFNNTFTLVGELNVFNSTTKIDYSTFYNANYSLIQQLLSSNLSTLLNKTIDVMRNGVLGNLTYNLSIRYGQGGVREVQVNGQSLKANLHNLSAYLHVYLNYNKSVFGTPVELSYSLEAGAKGYVEVLQDGLLYSAQLTGTSNSTHGADFMGAQFSDQGSVHTLSMEIRLVSTNLIGDPSPDYVIYIVPATVAVVVVGYILARKFM
ncbi:hypothetical protein HS1genome_0778 [Sulfodiicoccus acidiphilus]|uniref:Uncharacterized protein n=1 Tax=Sulfodiicoccus acidiphilus TaxID=1670455 RepID=A0A348B2I7_9CREN|nr:hypothetical protein [Sulfodiicoccus acidiphilus]BBD72389.1 hypothetical protein HS1genome_0778 [Sulfodiicoccus acidiphilus]GGT97466.1 hypothetical protein GCM10007116_13770 [Sulfodiicoccus acidiphilus]